MSWHALARGGAILTLCLFIGALPGARAAAPLLARNLVQVAPRTAIDVDDGSASYDDPAPYCRSMGTIDKPDARYTGPAVPDWLARALRKAAGASPSAPLGLFKHAVWRCADGHVLACTYGANIPCDSKAETSRKPNSGAVNFCRDNPEADVVPAAATGHATIYEWRCREGKPQIAREVLRVDAQGFPSAFWYRVTPEQGRAH